MIGEGIPSQIASFLEETETALSQSGAYVGYVRLAYILNIVMGVLIIAGIVLIQSKVRVWTRTLGIVFLLFGLVTTAVILIGGRIANELPSQAIEASSVELQVWASQLAGDFLVPLQFLGIGFLASGIALLVVSFFYRPRQTL